MWDDPTDETYRKARRLRNTKLMKYERLVSLGMTLLCAGAMYIGWMRKVQPYLNDERYKDAFDDLEMMHDYYTQPLMKGVINKLIERKEAKNKEESESKDI